MGILKLGDPQHLSASLSKSFKIDNLELITLVEETSKWLQMCSLQDNQYTKSLLKPWLFDLNRYVARSSPYGSKHREGDPQNHDPNAS